MPDAAVIETGDGGGGGGIIESIRAHPLLAAAVVGGAAGLFVLARRSGATAGSSSLAPSGGQLAPSANAALGQISYDVTKGFGEQSVQAASNFDAITAALSGISTQVGGVGTQVGAVNTSVLAGQAAASADFKTLLTDLLAETHEIRTEVATGQNPTQAQYYRDAQTAFQNMLVQQVGLNPDAAVASPNSLAASNDHLDTTMAAAA